MSTEFSFRTRTQNIETLKKQPLDVLVIGGGIVGAGLIRDLALNGGLTPRLRGDPGSLPGSPRKRGGAGLIEQGDFASGTSNATSELVHGGFRYLLKRDIALVKEARKEREILLRIAPNLVKPLPIAILSYKGEPYPFLGIHLAARYYNYLSKANQTEKAYVIHQPQAIQQLVGPIETKGLKGCVIIWDSTVDDARLTLLTIQSAHRYGGIVTNYVRFLEFITSVGNHVSGVLVEDVLSGEQFQIHAKKIVVATGPWIEKAWRKDPSYDGNPKLTTTKAKGTHLLIPRISGSEHGILAFTHSERSNLPAPYRGQQHGTPRVLFILPCEPNLSMIGTTESQPEDEPDRVRPSAAEVEYLITEASRVFPHANISRSSVVSAYAGVRPLVATEDDGFVSREHKISQSPSGVMYIYGGKLTTYRKIGEEAVDQIAAELHFQRTCRTSEMELLEGDKQNFKSHANALSDEERQRLIQRYGSGVAQIEKLIERDATLADKLIESLPFLKVEVHYACWGEMVIKLEDFLWRRTRIGLSRGQGVPQAPDVAKMIGQACGWDSERVNAEVEQYTQRIRWLNYELTIDN